MENLHYNSVRQKKKKFGMLIIRVTDLCHSHDKQVMDLDDTQLLDDDSLVEDKARRKALCNTHPLE